MIFLELRFIIFVIVSMTIFIIALFVVSIKYREANRRMKDLSTLYENALHDYEQLKASMVQNHIQHNKKIEQLSKESETLKTYINRFDKQDENKMQWDSERKIRESQLIQDLREYIIKGDIPEYLWEQLFAAADYHMPTFMKKISNDKTNLTYIEQKISILIRLHFNNTDIQNLLNITPQTLTNKRSNINKKLFSSNGAKTLNANIMRL